MENVISCRLEDSEVKFLNAYSAEKNEPRGRVIRELLEEGRKMEAMNAYKNGKASVGLASRIAGVPLSEFIDLLAEFGVRANVTVDDFRESLDSSRKLLRA